MELSNETFGRVAGMVNIPITTVQYNGSYNDVVCFLVGRTDQFNGWVYGIALYVTQDFKIKRVERIRVIQSTSQRNRPTERITIPIFKQVN